MLSGTVLVIRHAEKSGDPLDPDLNTDGRARAESLARFIPDTFGTPGYLFAAANSKHSRRPYETLKPLADQLSLAVDMSFADQDYAALAQTLRHEVRFQDSLIVVCWHHGNIPSLAHALKALGGEYPDPWDRDVFNLILRFKFAQGIVSVSEVMQPF